MVAVRRVGAFMLFVLLRVGKLRRACTQCLWRRTLAVGTLTIVVAAACRDDAQDAPLAPRRPSAAVTAQAINLLTNPGFESGPTGWVGSTSGGRSVVTTQAHSGLRSQQIIVSSSWSRTVHQDVAVIAGNSYDAAAWASTSGVGGAGAQAFVQWLNASGLPGGLLPNNTVAINVLGTLTGTNGWTQLSGSLTAPAGAVVARLGLKTEVDPDNAGTAWFDDGEVIPTTPDVTPPTVSITAPADGASVYGIVNVTASATDDVGVAGVQFQVDGVNSGAEDVTPPYTHAFNTTTVANGSYTLTAVARDAAGQTTTSSPVTVTVNNGARPNVVLMLTDDQRYDAMAYTPLLAARLTSETVKFTTAFATTPLCCPSRASLLTGLYSHNHGVLNNTAPNGGATKFNPSSTIATWLQQVGYRTGLYGKYLNEFTSTLPVPPGWSEFHAFVLGDPSLSFYYNYTLTHNGTLTTYGSSAQDYSTDVLAGLAVQFITSTPASQPLFLYVAPFAPHGPGLPSPSDVGSLAGIAPWRPPSFNEADVSDKPVWIRASLLLTATQIANSDALHQRQLESLAAVDRATVSIMDALVQTGRWDNTIFVFASDNGLAWGEHRHRDAKECVYEECVRVPLWIRVPGLASRTDDHLVGLIDLAPTIAEWAGALPATKVNGVSLVSLLNNPAASWRTEILLEQLGIAYNRTFQAVRTSQYVYAEYKNGDRELYDLQADPYQLTNVVKNPTYASIVNTLKSLLVALKAS